MRALEDFADVPEVVSHEVSTTKKTATLKGRFWRLLESENVLNSEEYDAINNNSELRSLAQMLQPNVVEGIRRSAYRMNYMLHRNSVQLKRQEFCRSTYQDSILMLMSSIANENHISVKALMIILATWLFNLDPKKKCLTLVGKTNRPNPSEFMLSMLGNSFMYRCDKLVYENIGVIQKLKQLYEGCSSLYTNVKYKDPVKVAPLPVIVTQNGTNFQHLFCFYPEEYPNFVTRCHVLYMNIPLIHRFNPKGLSALAECHEELLYLLHNYKQECSIVNYEYLF